MGMVLFTVEYAIAGIAAPGLVAFGDLAPPQLTLALEVQRAIGSGLFLLGIAFVGASIVFLAVGLHRAGIYHSAVAGLGVRTGVALLGMFAMGLFPASPVDVPFGLVALPLLFVWLSVLCGRRRPNPTAAVSGDANRGSGGRRSLRQDSRLGATLASAGLAPRNG